jgi:hypothetical protein
LRPAQPGVMCLHLAPARDAKHPPRKGPGRMRWQPGLSGARPLEAAAPLAVAARLARRAVRWQAVEVPQGAALPRLASVLA